MGQDGLGEIAEHFSWNFAKKCEKQKTFVIYDFFMILVWPI